MKYESELGLEYVTIMRPLLERSSRYVSRLKRTARLRWNNRGKSEVIKSASLARRPDLVFGSFNDDLWWWANTTGYREHQVLRQILPSMPDEIAQVRFTGFEGDATMFRAFEVYARVKRLSEKHLGKISSLQTILDFGCGWGRVVRLFLKDLDPSRIWGVDCLSGIIEVCQQTNTWCNFRVVDPLPPTSFPDHKFDLVYSYSVFSHLSEDAHNKWLLEFNRLLKPGGLLIASTWGRQFIKYCRTVRQVRGPSTEAGFNVFPNTEQSLSDYDKGNYCYHPLHGGDILDTSFFGETCIPKGYVLEHWTKQFEFLEFIEGPDSQNTIVVKKFA
jgi:ubiquinone/menaquinone biosynthesis C-methylase UbiE